MKKIVCILLCSLGITYLHGQEFYVYIDGQKRVFEVSETKMLLKSASLNAATVKNKMQKKINGQATFLYKLLSIVKIPLFFNKKNYIL